MTVACQQSFTITVAPGNPTCVKVDPVFLAAYEALGAVWSGQMVLQPNGDYTSTDNVGNTHSIRANREIPGQWNYRIAFFGNSYSANGPSSAGSPVGLYTASLNLLPGVPNTVTMSAC